MSKSILAFLNKCDQAYYNEGVSLVSDPIYDGIKSMHLSTAKPAKANKVGAVVPAGYPTVKRKVPMLSLGNRFTSDEVYDFFRDYGVHTLAVEHKYDGISIELTYDGSGVLVSIATRGDGVEGMLLEGLVCPSIPTMLSTDRFVTVRGELMIKRKVFELYNESAKVVGNKTYTTPRNMIAGLAKPNNDLTSVDPLFVAFDATLRHPETGLSTQKQLLRQLSVVGFNVPDEMMVSCKTKDIEAFIATQSKLRDSLDYDTDGLVFKVNNRVIQAEIGNTARSPRWAIAYKYPAEEGLSSLTSVVWQLGRTGRITPVAKIEPIFVGGVMISSPTLHNVGEIQRLDVQLNDLVMVKRSCDVIPHIYGRVEQEKRRPIDIPSKCLGCGGAVVLKNGVLYCKEGRRCKTVANLKLNHFFSRDGLNVKGVGDVLTKRLVDEGLLDYKAVLTKDSQWWSNLIGVKQGMKVAAEIDKAVNEVPFSRILNATGISHVGKTTAHDISKRFVNFTDLIENGSVKELMSIEGIGELTANEIILELGERALELKILDAMFTQLSPRRKPVDVSLFGVNVVVSGSDFGEFGSRADVEDHYRSKGARLSSSISKKTNIFHYGTGYSESKLEKAKLITSITLVGNF